MSGMPLWRHLHSFRRKSCFDLVGSSANDRAAATTRKCRWSRSLSGSVQNRDSKLHRVLESGAIDFGRAPLTKHSCSSPVLGNSLVSFDSTGLCSCDLEKRLWNDVLSCSGCLPFPLAPPPSLSLARLMRLGSALPARRSAPCPPRRPRRCLTAPRSSRCSILTVLTPATARVLPTIARVRGVRSARCTATASAVRSAFAAGSTERFDRFGGNGFRAIFRRVSIGRWRRRHRPFGFLVDAAQVRS